MRTEARELLAVGIFGSASLSARIETLLKRGREFSPRVSHPRIAATVAILLTFATASGLAPRWIAFAQPGRPSFDVTSVKPNTGGSERSTWGFPPQNAAFTATNINLKTLIRLAYKVKASQILGAAGWVDSDRYDIAGKPGEPNTGLERSRTMLRTLLQDRFDLTVHHEVKPIPVYELRVAGNGPKLPPPQRSNCVDPLSSPAPEAWNNRPPCRGFLQGPGLLTSAETSAGELADVLGNMLDRPVIDKTASTGTFYMRLEFAPDRIAEPDASQPSLFTVLREQLGLKLESRKDPMEVIVIDRVEKPDAN